MCILGKHFQKGVAVQNCCLYYVYKCVSNKRLISPSLCPCLGAVVVFLLLITAVLAVVVVAVLVVALEGHFKE